MFAPLTQNDAVVQRVRAILLTEAGELLLIKRVKPHKADAPYWVAPGGGVEPQDADLLAALHRELYEELGAQVDVLHTAFVLHHQKKDRNLEEHFFVCRLLGYDLSLRTGPEFDDPTRGEYIPEHIALEREALASLPLKTPELGAWLLENLAALRQL